MRIYKTRAMAADACKKGRITMNGVPLKPSRTFAIGNKFSVRKGPITFTYEILKLSENRPHPTNSNYLNWHDSPLNRTETEEQADRLRKTAATLSSLLLTLKNGTRRSDLRI